MNKEDVLEYLQKHNEIREHFKSKRRFWISYIPRPCVKIFTDTLSEEFNCKLICREIPPLWEFVFYDPDTDGNGTEELESIAKKRADYLDNHT